MILSGDLNGETGRSDFVEDSPLGRWAGGTQLENGRLMVQECRLERWFLPATFVNRPERKKWTYCGNFIVKNAGVRRRREYDHFICSNNLKGRLKMRSTPGLRCTIQITA